MNTPDSAKGLKTFSKKFLNDILKLNLKTPPDVVTGLIDTEGVGVYNNYQEDLGNDSVIHNYRVKNPGSIDTNADAIRKKLFGKNRPLNQADFSELGNADTLGYTYYALSEDIGKLAQLSDYTVPSLRTVANQFDLSSAESIKVNILNNRFIPDTIETFETKVLKNNNPQQPYVDDNGQISNGFEPQQLTPGDILSLNVSSSYNYTDDPISYLKYSGNVLQNETLLMNIAALELRSALDYRINQAKEINNTLSANLTDAMSNPLTAINILKDPVNNMIGKNYNITVPQNVIGKAEQVIGSLTGTYDVVEYLNLDYSIPLTPTCFKTTAEVNQGVDKKDKSAFSKFADDLFGRSVGANKDTELLNNTGSGQKFQLYANLYYNKYAPNYDPQYQSGVFQTIDKTLQSIGGVTGFLGLTGGKRPTSRYYYGDKTLADPFFVTSDSYGNQIKSPEQIVVTYAKDYETGNTNQDEYKDSSSYGSITTDFIWHKNGYSESFEDLKKPKVNDPKYPGTRNLVDRIDTNNMVHFTEGDERYSYTKQFKEGSILWKTQKLLDNADTNSGVSLSIEQTKTKFFDGFSLYSKGSAVIAPYVEPLIDAKGNKIGNKYSVPGVDETTGKRSPVGMNAQSEFCRTWTKARPYMGVTTNMRYSELLRLERNSVLDRYNNYNIFPSKLNVNSYTNKQSSIFDKYNVKTITEDTAKKYMFSIENLAWRDSTYLDKTRFGTTNGGDSSMPNSQRGPNGGRVMWFPPYDLKFTDDSTANWTTHQFLGRSEPIYTYNNTERSGTLSFKIVVDHPTILNVLVQKELKNLSDETVDEILNAFWAGCVNFDIYELARIWDKLSVSDIKYFEKVISGLDTSKTNKEIVKKLDDSGAKTPTEQIEKDLTTPDDIKPINGTLFFENDVPLLKEASTIKTYDEYFNTYVKLNQGDTTVDNSSKTNNKLDIAKSIYYDRVIGSNSTEKYFLQTSLHPDAPIYNLYQGYTNLKDELSAITTSGNNVVINLDAYTSSLDQQDQPYNKDLAIRRFKSVAKWIVLKYLATSQSTQIKNKSGDIITDKNIDNNFTEDGTIVLYRASGAEGHDDEITIKLNTNKNVDPADAMKAIGGITYINPNNVDLPVIPGSPGIPVAIISYGSVPSSTVKTYICTDTYINKNILIGKTIKINGVSYILSKDNFGCLVPSKKDGYTEADVVCSVTSIYASFNRKVDVKITLTPNNNIVKETTKTETKTPLLKSDVEQTNNSNITKREIAQKLLNRLITEDEYFKELDQNSPTVFKTMAEKLKYFTPAFHSTTPEGLNSRLTFLQQCLRPGESIKQSNTVDGAMVDARNTSFGKPPICVLRIGDFYNTKIVINSLNISYDPLVFDLNPEGIGVQPMIANVTMSFKYIGGSGLRQYVNKLQNALSFNYYANADVYESRSYANTDPMERELINAEVNPFNKNTLDLIPIVAKAKTIYKNDTTTDVPIGTIGDVVPNSENSEYLGANDYTMAKASYVDFDMTKAFEPGTYVTDNSTGLYGKNYYKRLFDDTLNFSVLANAAGLPLTDTNAWQPVINKNFGQQYYLNLYGTNNDLKTIKISYRNIYKKTYENYIKNINTYIDFITFDDSKNKKNKFLLHNILNKNYSGETKNKASFLTEFVINNNYMSSIQNNIVKKQYDAVTTISNYFDVKAANGNYVNYLMYSEKNVFGKSDFSTDPMKLYLYPQSLFYVNPSYNNNNQKTSILSGNTYNPGYFTDGESGQKSDVANIYIKNNLKTYHTNNIITYFYNDLVQKMNNDLLVFWFKDINVFNNYITDTTETQKNVLRNYLTSKLSDYKTKLIFHYLNDIIETNNVNNSEFYVNLTGISCVVNGYDAAYVDGVITKYAVIPNESKLNTPDGYIFGYDPYDKIPNILYVTGTTYNYEDYLWLKDVKAKLSGSSTNKVMLTGNNLYMYRQLSASPSVINSNLLKNNTSYSTIYAKTVLPKSIALDGAKTIGLDDYNFTITGTTGANTITFDDYTDVTTNEFNLLTEALSNVTVNKTLKKRYKMSFTYEKLSYEVLDFSNKTLGVILNDNSNNYEIGIYPQGYFYGTNNPTLKDMLKYVYGNSFTDDIYNLMYPKSNDGFYYYNVDCTGTTDTMYSTNVGKLNTALEYNARLTSDYINNKLSVANIESTQPYLFLYNDSLTFTMSSLSEAVYLDFFDDLYKNKTTYLAEIMKKISDDQKSSTKSEKEKNREIAKVKSAFTAFFEQIGTYLTNVNTVVEPILSNYNDNVNKPLKTYVSSAFGTPNYKNIETSTITSTQMLKGNDQDYTLTLRKLDIDTPDMFNNIMIYNKKRK